LIGLIIATYRKARLELLRNFEFGRLRLAFLAAVVVYNWTEATFKALHPIWFVFYIIALDYPNPHFGSIEGSLEDKESEGESQLAYAEGGGLKWSASGEE